MSSKVLLAPVRKNSRDFRGRRGRGRQLTTPGGTRQSAGGAFGTWRQGWTSRKPGSMRRRARTAGCGAPPAHPPATRAHPPPPKADELAPNRSSTATMARHALAPIACDSKDGVARREYAETTRTQATARRRGFNYVSRTRSRAAPATRRARARTRRARRRAAGVLDDPIRRIKHEARPKTGRDAAPRRVTAAAALYNRHPDATNSAIATAYGAASRRPLDEGGPRTSPSERAHRRREREGVGHAGSPVTAMR